MFIAIAAPLLAMFSAAMALGDAVPKSAKVTLVETNGATVTHVASNNLHAPEPACWLMVPASQNAQESHFGWIPLASAPVSSGCGTAGHDSRMHKPFPRLDFLVSSPFDSLKKRELSSDWTLLRGTISLGFPNRLMEGRLSPKRAGERPMLNKIGHGVACSMISPDLALSDWMLSRLLARNQFVKFIDPSTPSSRREGPHRQLALFPLPGPFLFDNSLASE
jgi:hypothetical protein